MAKKTRHNRMVKTRRVRTSRRNVLEVTPAAYLQAVREGVRDGIDATIPSATFWVEAFKSSLERMFGTIEPWVVREAIETGIAKAFEGAAVAPKAKVKNEKGVQRSARGGHEGMDSPPQVHELQNRDGG